jgi:organic radical activating enzyme
MLRRHVPLYLETNGVDYRSLEKCIDQLDHISMDMKLPSTTSGRGYWKEHRLFLETAATRNVFVKIVVSETTSADEIRQACDIILSVDGKIPLVLQPLTVQDGRLGICGRSLVTLQESASRIIRNVRVIPQTHKFLGLA